jgi:hypothetical protein
MTSIGAAGDPVAYAFGAYPSSPEHPIREPSLGSSTTESGESTAASSDAAQ